MLSITKIRFAIGSGSGTSAKLTRHIGGGEVSVERFNVANIRITSNVAFLGWFDVHYESVYVGAVIKGSDGRYLSMIALAKDQSRSLEHCGEADSREAAAGLVVGVFLDSAGGAASARSAELPAIL